MCHEHMYVTCLVQKFHFPLSHISCTPFLSSETSAYTQHFIQCTLDFLFYHRDNENITVAHSYIF